MCTRHPRCPNWFRQAGVSLVELIMFIVIVSVAVAGILLVMNKVTGRSADILLRKQALAAAESLLEEIELHDFISQSGVPAMVTQANRANTYHIVSNYNAFGTAGIVAADDVTGTPIAGLANYSLAVTVAQNAFAGIPAASAVLITVTATDPVGQTVIAAGYRTAY